MPEIQTPEYVPPTWQEKRHFPFPEDTWVELERQQRRHDRSKCASGKSWWHCFKCGCATPVGSSWCPNDNECSYRIMGQRNEAESELAAYRERYGPLHDGYGWE